MGTGHFWACPVGFFCSSGLLVEQVLCLLHPCGEHPFQSPEKGVNLEVYQVEHH